MYKDLRGFLGSFSRAEYAFIFLVNNIATLGAYLVMTSSSPGSVDELRFFGGFMCWILAGSLIAWIVYDENYKLLRGDQN